LLTGIIGGNSEGFSGGIFPPTGLDKALMKIAALAHRSRNCKLTFKRVECITFALHYQSIYCCNTALNVDLRRSDVYEQQLLLLQSAFIVFDQRESAISSAYNGKWFNVRCH
jgi:hypothetical protein